MAQLLERLLPTVHGSNPVIRKNFIEHLFTVNCIEIDENKEKEAVNGPFKKVGGFNFAFPETRVSFTWIEILIDKWLTDLWIFFIFDLPTFCVVQFFYSFPLLDSSDIHLAAFESLEMN